MSGELWMMARNGTTLLPGEARKLAVAYDLLRRQRHHDDRIVAQARSLTAAWLTHDEAPTDATWGSVKARLEMLAALVQAAKDDTDGTQGGTDG